MKDKFALVWDTLYNWRELWLWPVIAFINLKLLVLAAYLTTGRWPQESADALVGLGMNILLVAVAIGLTSAVRESTGYWFKSKIAADKPHILWSQMTGNVICFIAILWALKH
jgi:hypothetical protein